MRKISIVLIFTLFSTVVLLSVVGRSGLTGLKALNDVTKTKPSNIMTDHFLVQNKPKDQKKDTLIKKAKEQTTLLRDISGENVDRSPYTDDVIDFVIEEEMLVEDERDQMFEEQIRKMERKWFRRVKDMFKEEFGLGDADLNEYKKILHSYNEEKMSIMWKYYGWQNDQEFDFISFEEDRDGIEGEIREQYLDKLVDLIGEDNYYQYISSREDFNDEIESTNTGFEEIEVFQVDL